MLTMTWQIGDDGHLCARWQDPAFALRAVRSGMERMDLLVEEFAGWSRMERDARPERILPPAGRRGW
jgi:hypothetical protein